MMKPGSKAKTDQQSHWDKVFTKTEEFFGEEPSEFAHVALPLFRQNGVRSLLELGCGQGRDTFLFVQNGIEVAALDYMESAVAEIRKKAVEAEVSDQVRSLAHDLREPLPFAD